LEGTIIQYPKDDLVIVEDLHYAYPPLTPGGEPIPVLKGVDLRVRKGEFLALMGPTGVGKTTFCLTLNGILPHLMGGAFEGKVVVAGMDTRDYGPGQMSCQVGLVFQDPESQLFNMTVEDEVAFGLESLGLSSWEMEERIAWALEVVRLPEMRKRHPLQLSGGQKKRLAIATVLAMRPQVLVLDEPVTGLDPLGQHEVLSVVEQLKTESETTTIMVEQDAEAVMAWADRVVILEEGRLVLEGSPRQVFSQVEALHDWGLAVPQLSELAHLFNQRQGTSFHFITEDEACSTLVSELRSSTRTEPRGSAQYRLLGTSWDHRIGVPNLLGMWRDKPQQVGDSGPLPTPISKDPRYPISFNHSPAIQVEDLYYRYDGGSWALAGVDLSVEAGDFLAIVGQNGSGKTTLVKHFNGLLRPSRGQVVVLGQDTAGQSVGQLARKVGYLFQNPDHQIFAPTVREEVAFGPRNLGFAEGEVAARTSEALALFGLGDHADTPPAVLGYGLRRKVTLAAVWAMHPQILVLDEPTAGLDWRSTRTLMEEVANLNRQGHTIVLVTHDMKLVAEFAHQVLVLNDGQVLAYGPARQVFQQEAILRRAFLAPPPITALAQRMRPYGLRGDSLTAQEFYQEYTALQRLDKEQRGKGAEVLSGAKEQEQGDRASATLRPCDLAP
jgi:energy-coupling factor transport system ATP-binding protein